MELSLTRPLAVFDLETTGTNISTDRIVEICIVKAMPDGSRQIYSKRINPVIPISKESISVHGITDLDVKDCPRFNDLAVELDQFLTDCDLSGYNAIKFDIPLLVEEFLRAGIDFSLMDRNIVDVQNIFHKMEPRTLKAAYRFYCGKELEMAHSAEADTLATLEVLQAQLDKYEGVDYNDNEGLISKPVRNDVKALHDFSFYTRNVDLVGHIVFNDKQEEVLNFGKYKGQSVEQVFKKEPSYFDWMMKSQFPLSTKRVIQMIWKRMGK
ncbi:MAG TPA: 3'-5' exonuclease [Bacteroidales bacterium]|nr:3'-5' exonuclease [Bacteroidales bacterium]